MTDGKPAFRRSRQRMIAGICGGLAEKMGWSPDRVRLGYVVLSILSAAFQGIMVYVVLLIVVQ